MKDEEQTIYWDVLMDGYGSRNLAQHLKLLERSDELSTLISDAKWNILTSWDVKLIGVETGMYTLQAQLDFIQSLEQVPQNDDDQSKRDMLIEGHRRYTSGCILAARGNIQEAIDEFRQSLIQWRVLNNLENLASTMCNMAGLMGENGDFYTVITFMMDAIQLWKKTDNQQGVFIGLFTMANIMTQDGDYRSGRDFYEQAIEISKKYQSGFDNARLLIGLSECQRKLDSFQLEQYSPEYRLEKFDSVSHPLERVITKLKNDRKDKVLTIRCLLELAQIYRTKAEIQLLMSNKEESVKLINLGVACIKDTLRVADREMLYYQEIAQVELAIFYQLQGNPHRALHWLSETKTMIPDNYYIIYGLPSTDINWPILWLILARIELISGQIKFKLFEQSQKEALLREATVHLTLALEYSNLFSKYNWQIRQIKEDIYEMMKILNLIELTTVNEEIFWAEKKHALGKQSELKLFLDERGLGDFKTIGSNR